MPWPDDLYQEDLGSPFGSDPYTSPNMGDILFSSAPAPEPDLEPAPAPTPPPESAPASPTPDMGEILFSSPPAPFRSVNVDPLTPAQAEAAPNPSLASSVPGSPSTRVNPLGLPASTWDAIDSAIAQKPVQEPPPPLDSFLPQILRKEVTPETPVQGQAAPTAQPAQAPSWTDKLFPSIAASTAAASAVPGPGALLAPVIGAAGAIGSVLKPEEVKAPERYETLDDVLAIKDPKKRDLVLSTLPAEKFAEFQFQHEQRRKDMVEAEKIRAKTALTRDAENEAKAYQVGLQARQRELESLNEESRKLASEKIDEKRWWKEGGTSRFIFSMIAAVLGGITQRKTGGPNLALEGIMREIDRDIEVQKANLANKRGNINDRRGIVAELVARGKDVNEAGRIARIASYDRVIAELDQKGNEYDPQGTQMLRKEQFKRQLLAERAAAEQKNAAEEQKRAEAAAKVQLEKEKFEEEKRQAKEREKLARGNQSLDWTRLADQRRENQRRAEFDDKKLKVETDVKKAELADKAAERTDKKTDAETKEIRELAVAGGRRAKTEIKDVKDPATGKMVKREVTVFEDVDLIDPDTGKLWKAADRKTAADLGVKRTSVQSAIDLLDDIKTLRKKEGGANKLTSAGTKAEFDQLVNSAIIEFAASKGLSIADEGSIKQAKAALFGGEVDGYNIGDLEKRLENKVAFFTDEFNRTLRNARYKGELPKFDRRPEEAKLTPEQELAQKVVQGKTPVELGEGQERGALGKAAERVFNPIGEQPAERRALEVEGSAGDKGVSSQQVRGDLSRLGLSNLSSISALSQGQADAIRELAIKAKDPSTPATERDQARMQLVRLASTGSESSGLPYRPALNTAVLNNVLEEQFPDLWEAAVNQLKEEDREPFLSIKRFKQQQNTGFGAR